MEGFDVPREPPELAPFNLDTAVFLADFAFEAYRVSGSQVHHVRLMTKEA